MIRLLVSALLVVAASVPERRPVPITSAVRSARATHDTIGGARRSAPVSPVATITVYPGAQTVRIVIALSKARDTIRFHDPTIPRDAWTIQSAGVHWHHGALVADTPLRRVVLAVGADTTENGRGYLSVVRVGTGWQLHGPAFRLADHDTRLLPSLPRAWMAWPRTELARGYFYVGPRAQRTRRATHEAIVGTTVPASLRALADSALTTALTEHARRFGTPLTDRPVMIITRDGPPGSFSYRGDVTDGGVMSLRFGRDLDVGTSASARQDVWLFVAHEAAHLWNSHQARADDVHPFLHEGGAEYAALRAGVATGVLSYDDLQERLSGRLTECRRQVGVRDSLSRRMARGGAVYDCGTVLQWLTDLDASADAGGYDRTWRSLLARSVEQRAPFTLQQFRAAQPSTSLARQWFDVSADRRWDAFDERLRSRGVTWDNTPNAQEYVVAALLHLGRQVCARGASVGFALTDGRLQFDREPQCGPIAAGPAIFTLEDVDPLTDGATLFDRVEQRCRRKEPVRLRADSSNRTILLPCTVPPVRPVAYRLTSIPRIIPPAPDVPVQDRPGVFYGIPPTRGTSVRLSSRRMRRRCIVGLLPGHCPPLPTAPRHAHSPAAAPVARPGRCRSSRIARRRRQRTPGTRRATVHAARLRGRGGAWYRRSRGRVS